MKILFDGDIYSRTSFGGMVRYCNQLINGLVERGIQVDLVLSDRAREPRGSGFPRCRRIQGTVDPDSYDLRHCSYCSGWGTIQAVPRVLTVHDMIDEMLPGPLVQMSSMAGRIVTKASAVLQADHVVAISHTTKRDLLRHVDVPEHRISVIHHGLDPALAADLVDSQSGRGRATDFQRKPYILHVGGREGYKNFTFLLRAFARSNTKDHATLVAVGSQQHFLADEQVVIDEHGLSAHVALTGYVPDEHLTALYAGAALVVVPSLYEGFGYPLLEAMACGAPIACSSAPALLELGQGVPLVFDPHDVHSAARALEDGLFQDHSERVAQGRRIAQRMSSSAMIDQYIRMYERVLGNSGNDRAV